MTFSKCLPSVGLKYPRNCLHFFSEGFKSAIHILASHHLTPNAESSYFLKYSCSNASISAMRCLAFTFFSTFSITISILVYSRSRTAVLTASDRVGKSCTFTRKSISLMKSTGSRTVNFRVSLFIKSPSAR